MNKTELIQKVAIQTGLKRTQASLAVDNIFASIQESLHNGGNVQSIRDSVHSKCKSLLHVKHAIHKLENP